MWICIYTDSFLFLTWLTLAPCFMNLPYHSVYLFSVVSALLPHYGHCINPQPIFIYSHFYLPWYCLLFISAHDPTNTCPHQLHAMLDIGSITLSTKCLSFPVTGNNLYILVSMIFLTSLDWSRVRDSVFTWKPMRKSNFSRMEACVITYLGHFLSYTSNLILHLHCSLTTCLY